jgi:hypothetical protein
MKSKHAIMLGIGVFVIGLFATACAPLSKKAYKIDDLDMRIVVMDPSEMVKVTTKIYGTPKGGYIDYGPPITIYVPYGNELDRYGNRLPEFKYLGHELWHLKQLGGIFHKMPALTYK